MLFNEKILKWFDTFGRKDLPWQQNPTPYRVWVSEIMLQQTQVSTVIPYFLKFMQHFPDLKSLARASIDEVLHLWAGLGYYARAKNLHKSAQIIQSQYGGKFPQNFEEVVGLPGIGRSTAGAILALSHNLRFPILDGNVKRVLCRHFAIGSSIQDPNVIETLWTLSEKHTPETRVDNYTQAIMDLGATLCTRSKPNCNACPVSTSCQAKKLNQVMEFPAKTKRKAEKPVRATIMMLIVQPKQNLILLEKRPMKGIWGGLWSLPECELTCELTNGKNSIKPLILKKKILEKSKILLGLDSLDSQSKKIENIFQSILRWSAFRHTFTHFHLEIMPVLCYLNNNLPPLKNEVAQRAGGVLLPNFQWHPISKVNQLGLPAPVTQLMQQLKDHQH